MKINSKTWIVLLGAVVGFFAYFFNEPDKIIFGIPSYKFSVILLSLSALVGSFLIQIYMQWSTSKTALLIYLGIILGVIAVMFYANISPSAAPVVIIIISIFALPSAFLGAFSSKLIQYFKK